jgi:hypothetical protein
MAALVFLMGTTAVQAETGHRPEAIRRVIDEGRAACREAGGSQLAVGPDAIRSVDLNGDRREDVVVDFRDIQCAERLNAFCGTAGCDLVILLAQPDGRFGTVFQDRVWSYTFEPKTQRIRFAVHGSYCGKAGMENCMIRRRIGTTPIRLP